MNELIWNLLNWLLNNVMENEKVRTTIRGWGALLADIIPRNDIEDELGEVLQLLKEGLTGKKVVNK